MAKKKSNSRYVYLGKRVKDIKKPGLDSKAEFEAILKAILRDYKRKRITPQTAKGRLLLLYRLTFPSKNSKVRNLSPRTLQAIRKKILAAMQQIR